MAYIDEVATTYAQIASVIEIGTSFEGRPIRVLKLSNGPGKSAIFFDSVLHAREWIGPPTLLFAINELTENLASNQALLDANDWQTPTDSCIRGRTIVCGENRAAPTQTPSASAPTSTETLTNIGLVRNLRLISQFSYHDEIKNVNIISIAEGGAVDECSIQFPGISPFSEVEANAIAEFLLATPSITFYVAVHSYGMVIINENNLIHKAPGKDDTQ